MNSVWCRFVDANDPAIFGDNDFGFDGLAFLLAGIPALLFPAWPLDWLFRAVYDQSFGTESKGQGGDPQLRLHPIGKSGSLMPRPALANRVGYI